MGKFKRYLSLIMAFFILLTSVPVFATGQDVKPNDIKDHWAEKQIKWSYDKGYLSGYPDGSFKPQDNMTNAEYISLIIRILNGNKEIKIDNSNKQMWYSKFIAKAIEIGAIDKVENFEPGNNVTRDEAFRLLAFAYSVKGEVNILDKFTDKDRVINKEAIAGLFERSVVSGYPDKTLKPNNSITRAEIASIVYRGEEVAKLTKLNIDKKNDSNTKSIQVKESDRTNKSYSWNSFFNRNDNTDYKKPEENIIPDNNNDHKKPEENITPDNKSDEKDSLLQKLRALLNKEPEVKGSSNYKNADQNKKTAYDNAIDEGKKITKDNTLEEIKEAIKNIEDSQKALRPKSTNIKEEATNVINEAKKDDKEVDTEDDLDRKLNESRIQVDGLNGRYSIINTPGDLTVKGRVLSDVDVIEVGATIVTVDKETQLDGENIKLNGKEFTIDFSNLKPGSNKVNIYAYLADGTLLEKVIFVETLSTKLTVERQSIFVEDSENSNEETLNDISVFNSKTDQDVKYIGVLNGSKTSESIKKTNLEEKPVLFINIGSYVARQLDGIVDESTVKSDAEFYEDDEFLPNMTYYKTTSVNVEDLFKEDKINLYFSGFDTSQEPEMIFNENLLEDLEAFMKENNIDFLGTSEPVDSSEGFDELNNYANLNYDSNNANPLFMNYMINPVSLSSASSLGGYANSINILPKPSGKETTIPSADNSGSIKATGKLTNFNKYVWMSLHGGSSSVNTLKNLNKEEADKFTKSMIEDLWDTFYNDKIIKKSNRPEGVFRASVGIKGDIPLSSKDNKNVDPRLTMDIIHNVIFRTFMQMNLQYSKRGLEIFCLNPSIGFTDQNKVDLSVSTNANFAAILKEFVGFKGKNFQKNKNASTKSKLINNKKKVKDNFYFASIIIPPLNVNTTRAEFLDGKKKNISELMALTFDLYFTSEGMLIIKFNDKRESGTSVNGNIAVFQKNLENELTSYLSVYKKNKKTEDINKYKLYYNVTDNSTYKNYTSLQGTLDLINKLGLEISPRILGKRFLYLDTGLIDTFNANGKAEYYLEKSSSSPNNIKKFNLTGNLSNRIQYFLDANLEELSFTKKRKFSLIKPKTISYLEKEYSQFDFDKDKQKITGYHGKSTSKDIVVPKSIDGVPVKHIGDDVFKNNKNIKKIKRKSNNNKKMMYSSNSINTLAHSQFSTLLFSNNQLDYSGEDSQIVYLPDTIESIGKNAFSNCDIDEFDLPISLIKIDDAAFAYNKLKSLTLPTSLKEIGKAAFFENDLTQVELNNTIESIGDSAFYNNNIEKINFPDSIKEIGELAFYQNNIKEVKIPKSLLIIRDGVFGKNKIEKVDLGNSIIEIEDGAFSYNELKSVSIPNSVVKLGKMVFSENQLSDVEYPDSLNYIPEMVFYKNQLTHFNINNNIKIIGMSSFDSNKLTNLTIPNSVEKIGKGAFAHNQLVNLILPKKSIEYGQDAFRDNKLTRVEITGYRYDPMTIFDANVEVIKLP